MTTGELLADLARRGVRLWVDGDRLHYSAPHTGALNEALREAIRERRDELIDLLSAVRPSKQLRPLVEAPGGVDVRCSYAQERFLFSAVMDGSSEPYRLNAAFRILGALDVAALESSIRDIVRRHEVLRSRFEARDGGFVIVPTDWEPSLEVVEFRGSEDELPAFLSREARAEFDLMRGPHLSTTLYRLTSTRHVLLVSLHHIVSDGGSINIFERELRALYAWRTGLAPAAPPDPAVQFRDAAYWERNAREEDEARHLDFWKRDLEGAPTVLALPTDRPRPATRACAGGSVPLDLGAELLRRLREIKRASRLSEFQIVVSALWLLLHKYSGQRSIVIGTPWSNRERPGSENVIGPLLNLLPLHIRQEREATLGDLLAEVKARTLTAVRHGAVPFERIVSHVCPERSTAYTPIFQAMCAIDTTPQDVVTLAGLTIEPLDLPNEAARYDLAVVLKQSADALRGSLKYDRALFDETTAARMADHFLSALRLVLGDHATPIARAELMSDADKHRLLVEWNRTDRAYPLDRTLVDFFNDQVAASPDRVALECEGRSLTYGELDRRADAVARRLMAAGVTADDVVAITLDRSLELVVAILGVLKSGAAYLPIGAQHPHERRAWMLRDAAVKALIGPSDLSVPQVEVGDETGEPGKAGDIGARALPGAGCYVIYTSGSTGLPKGVVVEHRAIANNLLWMNDEWPLSEDDAVLFKSSPGFDVSVKEIFWPLIAGARLVVAPPGASGDPEQLCRIIRESRVSVVHMVPTMLDYFLRHESASDIEHLRIVMCGGEALSPALRSRFHKAFDAILLHLYGPTEAAIAVTGYAITSGHADVERLPLGRPMPNSRLYVLDSLQQPVPAGVPGELCIAGTPLARGYLSRPDLTAEKFVPDPFSGVPGARMYLTGDLARWRPDGQVEYLGRIDRQIKFGGFRIEPGEIEAVVRAQEGVDDALVVVRESGGGSSLTAYVASRSPGVSPEAVQRGLRSRLPAHMIPSRVVIIPAFPTNVNGKIDPAALPPPDAVPGQRSADPPQGELEEAVAGVWCEVLNLEAVDRDEDFFELGGHSLLVLQLQARLRDELGCEVSVANLFLHPTVASLATHVSELKIWRARRWLKKSFGTGRGSVN